MTIIDQVATSLATWLRLGGPGSGFYGHAGRSEERKRGGSVARSGAGRISKVVGEDIPEFDKVIQRLNLTCKDLHAMLDMPGNTELIFFPQDYTRWADEVQLDAMADGKWGNMERRFMQRGKELTAHFTGLYLSGTTQKQGFGTDLYKRQLSTLKRAGFISVTLEAGGSIGKYAWAKKGFDYIDSKRLAIVNDQPVFAGSFAGFAQHYNVPPPPGGWPKFKHAKEVAEYDDGQHYISGALLKANRGLAKDIQGDSFSLGKAFMLDNSIAGHGNWTGILYL